MPCKCGCGQDAGVGSQNRPLLYVRGHKPWGGGEGTQHRTPVKTWDDYPPPVRDADTGCLRWQGPHHSQGYGKLGDRYAHIEAWEREVGPVPEDHQLDHVRAWGCRYRDCVAIEHLEPVTQAENIRRIPRIQEQIARQRCPAGHPYQGKNLILRRGKRECRKCTYARNARNRRARAARRKAKF